MPVEFRNIALEVFSTKQDLKIVFVYSENMDCIFFQRTSARQPVSYMSRANELSSI